MNEIDVATLAALRARKEITQEDAAKVLGMSRSTYNSREKAGDFTEKEIEKLCKLLRVTRAEIEKKPGISPGSNSDEVSEHLNAISEFQRVQTLMLVEISTALGKDVHNKVVAILKNNGLKRIHGDKDRTNI